MTTSRWISWAALAAAIFVFVASAHSQPQAGTAGGGMGMGRGPASGPGWRAGPNNTPGWQMMTPEERAAHQQHMQGMTSRADCNRYMGEHHQQMAARAAQRGASAPMQPPRDMCTGLK